jgi:hypothetical protein
MKKIEKLSELNAFSDTVDDVFMTCHPGNDKYSLIPNRTPRKEVLEKREALVTRSYQISAELSFKEDSFWKRLYNIEKYRRDGDLLAREEVFSALPDRISVSPEIAFYLATDQKTYDGKLAEIMADDRLTKYVKTMTIDGIVSGVHPTHLLTLFARIPRGWKLMFENADAMYKAQQERDFTAEKILNVYKLTEITPGSYELARGKWGEERRILSAVAGVQT